jgi:hypothetical protein
MDDNAKLAALEEMAGKQPMKPHMAECPKCGHRWVMGEEDEYEDDEYEEG